MKKIYHSNTHLVGGGGGLVERGTAVNCTAHARPPFSQLTVTWDKTSLMHPSENLYNDGKIVHQKALSICAE